MLGISLVIVLFLLFTIVYFMPTILGFLHHHPNRWLILIGNVLLGGTVIGWFALLVYATSGRAHASMLRYLR